MTTDSAPSAAAIVSAGPSAITSSRDALPPHLLPMARTLAMGVIAGLWEIEHFDPPPGARHRNLVRAFIACHKHEWDAALQRALESEEDPEVNVSVAELLNCVAFAPVRITAPRDQPPS